MPQLDDIKVVLFDMDGTLLEYTWTLERICETLFQKFEESLKPVTTLQFFDVFWNKNMDMWAMMVDGVVEGDVARRYAFINTLRQLKRPPELAEPMLAYWEEIIITQLTLFPMALETLQQVSAVYHTGILTNGFHTVQRAKIARFHLDEYVEKVAVAEEMGFHKPDPRLFWRILEEFGCPEPGLAVYIGDSVEADVQGAKAAGLIPILFDPRHKSHPSDGLLVISRWQDLANILPLEGHLL